MRLRGIVALCGLLLLVSGCGGIQLEAGFKAPAEMTATAVAQIPRPAVAPNPQLGKLAFVRGGDLWVKALPDGEARRLTWDGRNSEPRWSPSGEWLAFWKDDRVWLARHDGSEANQLLGSRTVDGFAWSPVEDLIAYSTGSRLLAVGAAGTNRRELAGELGGSSSQTRLGAVSWSPDGQWLAYDRSETKAGVSGAAETYFQGVAVVRSDGSVAPRDLYGSTDLGGTWSYVAGWSVDGQHLLFWRGDVSEAESLMDGFSLVRLPVAGGDPIEVVPRMLVHRDLMDWSSEGKLAVVDGGRRETWDGKRIVVSTGAGSTPISDRGRADLFPSWSPDGSTIAYSSAPAAPGVTGGEDARRAMAERRIWITTADGSGKRRLTADPHYRDERPRWSADGSRILFGRIAGGQQLQLWLIQSDGSEPKQVVDELSSAPGPSFAWSGPSGYVPWDSMYDWWTGRQPARKPMAPLRLSQGR